MWTSSHERPETRQARVARLAGNLFSQTGGATVGKVDGGLLHDTTTVPFRLGGKYARLEGALRADAQRRSRLGVVSRLERAYSSVHALYVTWEWHEKNCDWGTVRPNNHIAARTCGDLEIVSENGHKGCYRWLWIDNYPNSSKQFYLFED